MKRKLPGYIVSELAGDHPNLEFLAAAITELDERDEAAEEEVRKLIIRAAEQGITSTVIELEQRLRKEHPIDILASLKDKDDAR